MRTFEVDSRVFVTQPSEQLAILDIRRDQRPTRREQGSECDRECAKTELNELNEVICVIC